jgi:hypothetical protein
MVKRMHRAPLLMSLLPFMLVLACGRDKGADGDSAADEDGDGVSAADDCDDNNPDVFPGAAETCDTVDNNCDGSVDEGSLLTFYADGDGDGFGVESSTIQACTPPSGHTAQLGDCDDGAATTFPGADEVCDSLDNNCDGSVDEGALSTFYVDGDGDGYGLAETLACEEPSGAAPLGGDCDDADPILTPEDYDADGLSSCDGDCDDTNANRTDRCAYSSMSGDFEVFAGYCYYMLAGNPTDESTICPSCDFNFEGFGYLFDGTECQMYFIMLVGYNSDLGALYFHATDYDGNYRDVGKFPASITYGSDYDLLKFSGYGTTGNSYEGRLTLHP